MIKCDASSFSCASLSADPPAASRKLRLRRAHSRHGLVHIADQVAHADVVIELLVEIGRSYSVFVTRGSSITVRGCVEVHDPTVSRSEYLPGTATGPLGPSGRALLIHGPG